MKNIALVLAFVSLTACGGAPIGADNMPAADAGPVYGDSGPVDTRDAGMTPVDPMGCEPGTVRNESCYDATCPGTQGEFFACLDNRTWQCIVSDRSRCTPSTAPDAGTPGADAGPSGCAVDGDSDGHRSLFCGGDDCNDSNASVHPGAAEICGNSIDEDCNGLADVCPSTPPACASDPRVVTPTACVIAATATSCMMTGLYVCNPDGRTICRGDIRVSETEVCGDGLDQDCNGMDIACASSCAPRTEICGNGIDEDCDGVDRACVPSCVPTTEICGNGRDEDCNGSDLACTASSGTTARVVIEFRVVNTTATNYGTVTNHRLRADDLSEITCLNTGSTDMLDLGDGWRRCVVSVTGSLVFVGKFQSTLINPGDILHTTSDWGGSSCYSQDGVQWRAYREDTGVSVISSSVPEMVRGSGGGCRHRITL